MNMNPEVKSEWLARLRDGKREQGRSYLKAGGKYCCLGVLCEIAEEQGVVESTVEHIRIAGVNNVPANHYNGLGSTIPEVVRVWAGLDEDFKGLGYLSNENSGDCRSLADLNDAGKTFPEIADIIEREL